jgi:hypothetical protein
VPEAEEGQEAPDGRWLLMVIEEEMRNARLRMRVEFAERLLVAAYQGGYGYPGAAEKLIAAVDTVARTVYPDYPEPCYFAKAQT